MPARRRPSSGKKTRRRRQAAAPPRAFLWAVAAIAAVALGAVGVLVWSRSEDGRATLLNLGAERLYPDVQVAVAGAIGAALPAFAPGPVGSDAGAADAVDWALPGEGAGAAIHCRVVPAPAAASWWEVQARLAAAVRPAGGRVLWAERLPRTGRGRDQEAPDDARDLLRVDLGVPGTPTHTLLLYHEGQDRPRVRWGAAAGTDLWTHLQRDSGAPIVALVIDDWGHGETAATRRLLDLDAPLTLAILPGLPFSRRYALEATDLVLPGGEGTAVPAAMTAAPEQLAAARRRAAGCPVTLGLGRAPAALPERRREVFLHLPMEPQGYPEVDPGPRAVMVGMAQADIADLLDSMLGALPGVTGVNNHMGSAATSDAETMQKVMDELHRRDLIFLDSLTSARSVAWAEARRAGVPAARNRLFLDHDSPSAATVRQRLLRLVEAARSGGFAVGIGHPHGVTAEVLAAEVPRLAGQGVRFVTVSELLALQEAAKTPVP